MGGRLPSIRRVFMNLFKKVLPFIVVLAAVYPAFAQCPTAPWTSTGNTQERYVAEPCNGYDYELWNQYRAGTATMTLTGDNGIGANARGGTFTASWTNTCNVLFRSGRKWSPSTQNHTQIGNMTVDYAATWSSNDGARMLGIYGWAYFTSNRVPTTRENGQSTSFSNQIEYYILQDRGGYNPATNTSLCRSTPYGEATIDGLVYEFRVCDRIGQPALTGNNVNFKQFFSIPKSTSDHRTSGTIDVTAHFNAWHAAGMYMDGPLYEVAMKLESYNCGNGQNQQSNFQGNGTGSVTRNILTIGGGTTPGNFTLTTNVTPDGAGTITRSSNPAGGYAPGTQVTLTRPTSADWVFSGWSGGGCTGTGATCVVTMNANTTVTAAYTRSPDANLIENGNFPGTSLPTGWTLNAGEGYGGSVATASVSNNRATINITSTGTNVWEPQLTQRGIELEQGRNYVLTFTAQSVGGGRNMEVLVQRVGEGSTGWTTYAQNEFSLTTASQNFSLPFTMDAASDPNAQLAFNLGGSTNNVIISNVSLTRSSTTNICLRNTAAQTNRQGLRATMAPNGGVNVAFMAAGSGTATINLYNLKGKQIALERIRTVSGMNYSHTFNPINLPNGIYVVGVRGGDGRTEQARVVVQGKKY